MPSLMLCDPGFCASVGVSKPAGASVAYSRAITAMSIATTARSRMRIEMYLPFMGVTTSGTDLNLFKPIQTGLHKTKADSRR